MADISDVEFQRPEEPPRDGGPGRWMWLGAVVLVLLGAGIYLWTRPATSEAPEPAATAEAPADAPAPGAMGPTEVDETLPPLPASDEFVRAALRHLSAHPEFASWLVTEDLVRTYAAVVDNVARGANPARHLRVLQPSDVFRATADEGRTTIDPRSYARYDAVGDVVNAIDIEGAAELYRRIHPLSEQAYKDLGYPEGGFDVAVARAINELLEVPILDREVELTEDVLSYEYADPALEDLSPAQKQLLRTGPRNVRIIQAQLRELARAIGLPDAVPAPDDDAS